MLDVSTVYEEELAACNAAREVIDWQSEVLQEGVSALSCQECGSGLLRPTDLEGDTLIECSRCGATESRELYVPRAIKEALAGKAYSAIRNGGGEPYTECPECYQQTYVMSERKCALCNTEAQHECERCGHDIPASEMMSSPLCGYCHYMYEKMLDE
jgi:hypothetical protein